MLADLPEENIYLFVHNVERENTETIVVDDLPRGTIFVECAFGNFGENFGHRVFPLIRIFFSKGQDFAPIGCEFVAKKHVHEKNLSDDVDKVEEFAEKEPEGIKIVVLNIGNKVVQNELLPSTFVIFINDWAI